MDKGIRPAARAKFQETLPQLKELGNTRFRKTVMSYLMEEFGCTLASAATHYNDAFKFVKANDPASVNGLGRPEDKKGGRKKKVRPEAAVIVDKAVLFIDQQMGIDSAAEHDPVPEPAVQEVAPKTFNVIKVSDGSIVGEGLDSEAAQAMIARALKQKKAKLQLVEA